MKNSIKTRHKNRFHQINNRNKPLYVISNPQTSISANQNVHLNNKALLSTTNKTPPKTWKFISLYIILIITLGMLVISSRNSSQVLNNITLSTSGCTLQPKSSVTSKTGSSLVKTSSTNIVSSSTSSSSVGASGDDNWKLGLYTNRTLGRDYDPLLVVVYDTLKTSVNYSSRLFKTTSSASLSIATTNNGEIVTSSSTAADDLLFNSCSGTTLRHYCRIKTSQLLQDLTFMAHMSMNLGQHATAHHIKSSLNPQLKHLIALAVYGDDTVDITDFWESLSLLDILLSDIYDYIPDKNR